MMANVTGEGLSGRVSQTARRFGVGTETALFGHRALARVGSVLVPPYLPPPPPPPPASPCGESHGAADLKRRKAVAVRRRAI